jgi:release factor glutamine methyltransferase
MKLYTIQEAQLEGRSSLRQCNPHNTTTYFLEVDLLLSHVLEMDRTKLYAYPEQQLTQQQQVKFLESIEKRKMGYPIAYLLGPKIPGEFAHANTTSGNGITGGYCLRTVT